MRETTLPNGMRVGHLSRFGETRFIYDEIFVDRAYLKGGVRLEDGDCVFDVGANIGLFALFVASAHPRARVFCFEPTPPVVEVLRANVRRHRLDDRVRVFDHGLSDVPSVSSIAYYPNAPGNSTTRPEEKDVTKAFVRRALLDDGRKHAPLLHALMTLAYPFREWIADRAVGILYRRVETSARFRPLSDVIDEEKVERIDLLKIDVEGAELSVLRGLREGHWPRVRQVAMELHDVDGRLDATRALLETHGFTVTAIRDAKSGEIGTFNVYAVRLGASAA